MIKKGFTLVELLTVIAILSILILMSLPEILRLYKNARMQSFENEVKAIYKQAQNQIIADSLYLNAGETKIYSSNFSINSNTEGHLDIQGGNNIVYCVLVDNHGNIKKLYVSNGTYQYISNDGIINIDDIKAEDIDENVNWQDNDVCLTKVTLNYNDEITPNEVISVQYLGTYGDLPSPTRNGYTFIGWSLETNESLLPEDYQEVEYIQSSGEQYIDTLVYPTNNMKIVFDMKLVSLNGDQKFLGSYGGGGVCLGLLNFKWRYGSSTWIGNSLSATTRRTLITIEDKEYKFNNDVISVNQNSITANNNKSIFVGGVAYNGSLFWKSSIRIYNLKIYDNGGLIRDFIPCYHKDTGINGLYDLVTGDFYTNLSTDGEDFSRGLNIYTIIDDSTIVENINNHTITAVWE